MKFNKINKIKVILLIGGILLLAFFFYKLGGDALELIQTNFNLKYLLIYMAITIFAIAPLVWRWQVILRGYKKHISFLKLLKIQLAGYAVSYSTPSARIGGEPLRIYMLKKECGVDYKTGSVSVILDRYMELLGTILLGIVGLGILLFIPEITLEFKFVAAILILISLAIVLIFYYRLNKSKGFFSDLFSIFLGKKKLKKLSKTLEDIDSRMSYFIIHHKKEFFLSFLFYLMSGFLFLIEFKYLLLSFGIGTNLLEIILIVVVLGAANFIPIPMALGSLEAGQSALFHILKNNAGIGFALSLVHRIRGITISLIGFLIIIKFSSKDLIKKRN
ncbi:hypothetical protein CMI47_02180 [Candidatus Pacearchaeota archaeon]|nr:hypothetical protein [Candidatus Pacearchaeota archaeon]|tara:strand:+ start:56 stop:1051 length:996 start_codon:yes stop_codon:yes gene_type:complete